MVIIKMRGFSVSALKLTRPLLRGYCSSSTTAGAETTALYDFHVASGGKIVNFGGFLLPVQYNDLSISASHLHTRKSASLFDVSHMLQTEIKGNNCVDYMETICTADLKNLKNGSSTLTVFTNANGGILDDLIITKVRDDYLYIVSNAAMKKQDQEIMTKALANYKGKNPLAQIDIQFFTPHQRALVALQGPKSAEILQKLTDIDLSQLYFMTSTEAEVSKTGGCRITRCGYTGEDGFEISIPALNAVDITKKILSNPDARLAGLGARDSLRLEAGLCLYGNDIDGTTTPIEASLAWLVAKQRRADSNFPGSSIILGQLKNGANSKRIGLIAENCPPARHGAEIVNIENGQRLGVVTSGCPSPSLDKKNIAMGYVPLDSTKIGSELGLKIRDKVYKAIVTKMPFVPTNYYVKPKK